MTFDEWYEKQYPNVCDYETAKEIWQAATLAEREECAKLVENRAEPNTKFTALHRAAKAIHARSNAN